MPHAQGDGRHASVDGDGARSRPLTAARTARDCGGDAAPIVRDDDGAEGARDDDGAKDKSKEEEEADCDVAALREELEQFFQHAMYRQDAVPRPSGADTDEQPLLRSLPQQLAVLGEDRIVVPMQVALDDSEIYRAINFQDGAYRGQATQMESSVSGVSSNDPDSVTTTVAVDGDDGQVVWVPHGIGVWASLVDGSTRCGQWICGVQSVLGTQQHRGVFLYEDEWHENQPWGYGVGTFANGRIFTDCWTHGRPDGLGTWRTMVAATNSHIDTTFGWFRGTQCGQAAFKSSSAVADAQ